MCYNVANFELKGCYRGFVYNQNTPSISFVSNINKKVSDMVAVVAQNNRALDNQVFAERVIEQNGEQLVMNLYIGLRQVILSDELQKKNIKKGNNFVKEIKSFSSASIFAFGFGLTALAFGVSYIHASVLKGGTQGKAYLSAFSVLGSIVLLLNTTASKIGVSSYDSLKDLTEFWYKDNERELNYYNGMMNDDNRKITEDHLSPVKMKNVLKKSYSDCLKTKFICSGLNSFFVSFVTVENLALKENSSLRFQSSCIVAAFVVTGALTYEFLNGFKSTFALKNKLGKLFSNKSEGVEIG